MAFSLDENSRATWWFMLLLSAFMLTIFSIMIPDAIHKYDIAESGESASVEITQVKETIIGSRHSYSLHFKYLGEEKPFIGISRKLFDAIKHKKETQLGHLPEYPNLFLAPDYDIKWQSISHVILVCFFAFMVPLSIYKIRTLRY
ncbi:MAG: hypothetical protein EOO60_11575 [Hymenobacter sp.]|nr:MAG: hypothetical protein EOO60_11575 [Hymenobacter sp.]